MRDAGCHLAKHGELGGLDQLVLCGTQGLLGTLPFGDFALQTADGLREIDGAFGDVALQCLIGHFEHGTCLFPAPRQPPSLALVEQPEQQTAEGRGGERGVGSRLHSNRFQIRKNDNPPGGA